MIDSFKYPFAFLSNFHVCVPFMYDGIEYTTVEAAYQAQKSLNLLDRMALATMSATDAKRAGKKLQLRSDWNDVRLKIMKELVTIKFQQPDLKLCLIMTGKEEIVEGNWWNDTFWGVCRGEGENHLGKILMQVRDSLTI